MRRARLAVRFAAALAAASVLAAACGKSEAPKVDAAKEQAAAHERARKDAFGAQVKALDDAKGMQEDLNKKAQENLDKVDSMSK